MDQEVLPFQVNLSYQVPREKEAEYIGKSALESARDQLTAGQYPYTHQLVGMIMGGAPINDYAPDFWLISESIDANPTGYVTSPWFSPELGQNIAMGFVPLEQSGIGTELWVHLPEQYADVPGSPVAAQIVEVPFRESVNPNQREILRSKGMDAAV